MFIDFIESHLQSPKGDDFFDHVTNQGLLVDKSNFIKQVIDSKEQAILITRPSGWGKSLNLSMLNYFFRIELNKEKQFKNKLLFQGGEYEQIDQKNEPITIKLKKLNITKDKEWSSKYSTHFGKYPVIYINLQQITRETFSQFVYAFQRKIKQLYSNFPEISQYLRNQFVDHEQKNYQEFKNSGKDLKQCLSFLIQLLHKIHQQKVIVLIDEYDYVWRQSLSNQLSQSDPLEIKKKERNRKKETNFISQIIKSIYDKNDKLEKMVIVGVTDIFPKQKGSGANSLKTYGVLDQEFSQSFGFSENEIKTFLNQIVSPQAYPVKNLIIQNLNQWYKGYTTPFLFQKLLFNSSTVIWYLWKCYNQKKIVDFQYFYRPLMEICTQRIIKRLISVNQTIIETLLQLNENTPTKLPTNQYFNLGNQHFWGVQDIDWPRLFLNFGCLTGKIQQNQFYALVPNKKMDSLIKDPTQSFQKEKEKTIFHPNLFINHRPKLKKQLKEFLKKDRKCFIGQQNKNMFVDIITGRYLFSEGNKTHKIYAGLESGFGLIDHLFEPILNKTSYFILHQYIFSKDHNKDPSNQLKALWSIYENNYLEQPLLIAAKNPWIQSITIRPIIIYAPDTPEALQLEIENVYHSIKEARIISQFFNKEQVKDILNIKNVDRQLCREELLKKFDIKGDILQLLEHIIEEGKPKFVPVPSLIDGYFDQEIFQENFRKRIEFEENECQGYIKYG